jgi:2-polyprenyl-3-methyl-5-hydroxy-6-metoxy-1,4-benzoquinol methylase
MNQSNNKDEKIACSICQERAGVVLIDKKMGLYKCDRCRHVFRNIPDEERERYDRSYFSNTHENWFKNPDFSLFGLIYSDILRLSGSGCRSLVDVGCGKGNFLRYIRAKDPGADLLGVDLMENKYPGINFLTGNILAVNIEKKFDVITCLSVIEHTASPDLCIKKFCELLIPGGIIFIATINDDGMIFSIAKLLKKIGLSSAYNRLYSKHHLQCFSTRSLSMLMKRDGLEVVAQETRNCPISAVDYPSANVFVLAMYKIAVQIIFFLSKILKKEMYQIIVCRKKS